MNDRLKPFRAFADLGGALLVSSFLVSCMPAVPAAPAVDHVVQPYFRSTTLAGGGGEATPSPADRAALRALLAQGREAGARRLRVEVDGDVSEARRRAIRDVVIAEAPGAEVVFIPGGRATIVSLRGLVGVPRRCLSPDPWFSDGRMPPGCAVDLAVDRMVDDPRDLLMGRAPPPGDVSPLALDSLKYVEGGERKSSTDSVARGKLTQGKAAANDTTSE